METNKTSSNAKAERLKMIRARSAARRAAVIQSVQSEEASGKSEQEAKAAFEDEKSLRSISTLTGYLGIAAALSVLLLVIRLWATLKAGYLLTPVSVIYILFSVTLIVVLVWCIKLVQQRRFLVMWVFMGFIALNYIYRLAFRLYEGKDTFVPSDMIALIAQGAILFEIYRLKRKGILN